MASNKYGKCDWAFNSQNGSKIYVKCSKCGRIKREDLPDVQPCLGSQTARATMLMKSFGCEMTDKEINRAEKEYEEDHAYNTEQ